MGDAFLTRRGAKEQKITFNDTPMVAVKTLSNVLSVPRYDAAVAFDKEYLALVCGLDAYGRPVSDIDFFNRSGKHWHASWPDELTNMSAIILGHRLIGIGGRYADGTCSAMVKRWALNLALKDEGIPVSMHDISPGRDAATVIQLRDGALAVGGSLSNYEVGGKTFFWITSNTKATSNDAGFINFSPLAHPRAYCAMCRVTDRGILVAGGIDEATKTLLSSTETMALNVKGEMVLGAREDLSAAQYKPATAEIYADDGTHCGLVGLGQTLPKMQGNLVIPATIVPYIDIFYTSATDQLQIENSKFGTITLPLEGRPTSAVGLSFGDCALFVVGYNDGVTKCKGYLIQLSPLRVNTMEFNFSRGYLQGGVIGNDVAYLACGNKNGQVSTDVEMIQLLRNVPIYPGMKYKVGSMASEETSNILTLHPLNDEIKLSGYMKL